MRSIRWMFVLCILAALAVPAVALGDDPLSPPEGAPAAQDMSPAAEDASPDDVSMPSDGWHLDLEVGTDFPISVGGILTVVAPHRIRISTGIGVFPSGYLDVVNAVVEGFGGYNELTGDLIAQTLKNSLVWRTHIGWRPWSDLGFYFDLGYGLVGLGGGLSVEELLATTSGSTPPENPSSDKGYNVSSTLHMIDVEVGWIFRWLDDQLSLRTALGFTGTLAASSTVEPNFRPPSAQLNKAFTDGVADYLNDTYTSYVFAPVITLQIGYRFF